MTGGSDISALDLLRHRLSCVGYVMLLVLPALGQEQAATTTDAVVTSDTVAVNETVITSETTTAPEDSVASVMFNNVELFTVAAASVIGAQERADRMSESILELAKSRRQRPEDLHLVRDDRIKATLVKSGDVLLGVVWNYEAEAVGSTSHDIASERLEIIRRAIIAYRHDFSAKSLIKGAIYAVITTTVFAVLLVVLSRLRKRFDTILEARVGDKVFLKILSGASLVSFTQAIIRLVHFITVTWLVLAFLNLLLSLFPWTYGIAAQVFNLAAGPLKAFGQAFLAEIPSLFFLAFIGLGAVFALRGIGFFFNEIERRRITISGFYPDWSKPTFNLVRIIVIAFAIVVAFPYIPGSSSNAFKGMSLFLGVLVSVGSGSAMANIVSGIILIYMRPYDLGDRVQIGDSVGDVVDRNLLTTRIRTPKNERITIPNTNILSGQIINFTSKRRTKELILYTSVTIGYDVPWRTVHELLIAAADTTDGIIKEPAPFVLQKGLQDFYIEYELNAHTDQPRSIPATYSLLHQNIQDKFEQAGVEILSPHYRVMRDGGPEGGPSGGA